MFSPNRFVYLYFKFLLKIRVYTPCDGLTIKFVFSSSFFIKEKQFVLKNNNSAVFRWRVVSYANQVFSTKQTRNKITCVKIVSLVHHNRFSYKKSSLRISPVHIFRQSNMNYNEKAMNIMKIAEKRKSFSVLEHFT